MAIYSLPFTRIPEFPAMKLIETPLTLISKGVCGGTLFNVSSKQQPPVLNSYVDIAKTKKLAYDVNINKYGVHPTRLMFPERHEIRGNDRDFPWWYIQAFYGRRSDIDDVQVELQKYALTTLWTYLKGHYTGSAYSSMLLNNSLERPVKQTILEFGWNPLVDYYTLEDYTPGP